jgi:hypothetical protein
MNTTVRRSLRVGETVTLELPYSEVAMHLRVAGEHRPVRVLEAGAQVLNPDGSPFSFPVLHGEAGIYAYSDGRLYADIDRTVRDLSNVTFVCDVEALEDRGNGYEWYPVADPTEGTADHPVGLSWGRWRECNAAEATHAVLGLTVWSDYSGGTVERSNERSLQRDFPGTFVHLYGGFGTSGLMITIDRPATYDPGTWLYVLEILAGLADYPVVDEEDLSALEMELAEEAWEAYLGYDVLRDLEKAGVPEDALSADTSIRDRFYALTYEADYGPEAESAVSVVFPFYDRVVATMAREMGGQS